MPFLGAFLIFVVLAAVTWAIGVALYQSWVGGPDLRHKQDYLGVATLAVVLAPVFLFGGVLVAMPATTGGGPVGRHGRAFGIARFLTISHEIVP